MCPAKDALILEQINNLQLQGTCLLDLAENLRRYLVQVLIDCTLWLPFLLLLHILPPAYLLHRHITFFCTLHSHNTLHVDHRITSISVIC
jgi:hypothetical protein